MGMLYKIPVRLSDGIAPWEHFYDLPKINYNTMFVQPARGNHKMGNYVTYDGKIFSYEEKEDAKMNKWVSSLDSKFFSNIGYNMAKGYEDGIKGMDLSLYKNVNNAIAIIEKTYFDLIKVRFYDNPNNENRTIVMISSCKKAHVVCKGEKYDKRKGLIMCLLKLSVSSKSYHDIISPHHDHPKMETAAALGALYAIFGKKSVEKFLDKWSE